MATEQELGLLCNDCLRQIRESHSKLKSIDGSNPLLAYFRFNLNAPDYNMLLDKYGGQSSIPTYQTRVLARYAHDLDIALKSFQLK